MTALGAAALQNCTAILRRHAGAKAVRLCTTTIVWLKSTLSHS